MTTTTSSGTRAASPGLPGAGMTVGLFITGVAVTTLLERLGCTVEFPREQTCCAQMTTNTGYFDEGIPTVRQYVRAFGDYDYIVAPSGSCVAAVRDQHPMLAAHAGDSGLAKEVETPVSAPTIYPSSSSTFSGSLTSAHTSRIG